MKQKILDALRDSGLLDAVRESVATATGFSTDQVRVEGLYLDEKNVREMPGAYIAAHGSVVDGTVCVDVLPAPFLGIGSNFGRKRSFTRQRVIAALPLPEGFGGSAEPLSLVISQRSALSCQANRLNILFSTSQRLPSGVWVNPVEHCGNAPEDITGTLSLLTERLSAGVQSIDRTGLALSGTGSVSGALDLLVQLYNSGHLSFDQFAGEAARVVPELPAPEDGADETVRAEYVARCRAQFAELDGMDARQRQELYFSILSSDALTVERTLQDVFLVRHLAGEFAEDKALVSVLDGIVDRETAGSTYPKGLFCKALNEAWPSAGHDELRRKAAPLSDEAFVVGISGISVSYSPEYDMLRYDYGNGAIGWRTLEESSAFLEETCAKKTNEVQAGDTVGFAERMRLLQRAAIEKVVEELSAVCASGPDDTMRRIFEPLDDVPPVALAEYMEKSWPDAVSHYPDALTARDYVTAEIYRMLVESGSKSLGSLSCKGDYSAYDAAVMNRLAAVMSENVWTRRARRIPESEASLKLDDFRPLIGNSASWNGQAVTLERVGADGSLLFRCPDGTEISGNTLEAVYRNRLAGHEFHVTDLHKAVSATRTDSILSTVKDDLQKEIFRIIASRIDMDPSLEREILSLSRTLRNRMSLPFAEDWNVIGEARSEIGNGLFTAMRKAGMTEDLASECRDVLLNLLDDRRKNHAPFVTMGEVSAFILDNSLTLPEAMDEVRDYLDSHPTAHMENEELFALVTAYRDEPFAGAFFRQELTEAVYREKASYVPSVAEFLRRHKTQERAERFMFVSVLAAPVSQLRSVMARCEDSLSEMGQDNFGRESIEKMLEACHVACIMRGLEEGQLLDYPSFDSSRKIFSHLSSLTGNCVELPGYGKCIVKEVTASHSGEVSVCLLPPDGTFKNAGQMPGRELYEYLRKGECHLIPTSVDSLCSLLTDGFEDARTSSWHNMREVAGMLSGLGTEALAHLGTQSQASDNPVAELITLLVTRESLLRAGNVHPNYPLLPSDRTLELWAPSLKDRVFSGLPEMEGNYAFVGMDRADEGLVCRFIRVQDRLSVPAVGAADGEILMDALQVFEEMRQGSIEEVLPESSAAGDYSRDAMLRSYASVLEPYTIKSEDILEYGNMQDGVYIPDGLRDVQDRAVAAISRLSDETILAEMSSLADYIGIHTGTYDMDTVSFSLLYRDLYSVAFGRGAVDASFRFPGTVPSRGIPHVPSAGIRFMMDECARRFAGADISSEDIRRNFYGYLQLCQDYGLALDGSPLSGIEELDAARRERVNTLSNTLRAELGEPVNWSDEIAEMKDILSNTDFLEGDAFSFVELLDSINSNPDFTSQMLDYELPAFGASYESLTLMPSGDNILRTQLIVREGEYIGEASATLDDPARHTTFGLFIPQEFSQDMLDELCRRNPSCRYDASQRILSGLRDASDFMRCYNEMRAIQREMTEPEASMHLPEMKHRGFEGSPFADVRLEGRRVFDPESGILYAFRQGFLRPEKDYIIVESIRLKEDGKAVEPLFEHACRREQSVIELSEASGAEFIRKIRDGLRLGLMSDVTPSSAVAEECYLDDLRQMTDSLSFKYSVRAMGLASEDDLADVESLEGMLSADGEAIAETLASQRDAFLYGAFHQFGVALPSPDSSRQEQLMQLNAYLANESLEYCMLSDTQLQEQLGLSLSGDSPLPSGLPDELSGIYRESRLEHLVIHGVQRARERGITLTGEDIIGRCRAGIRLFSENADLDESARVTSEEDAVEGTPIVIGQAVRDDVTAEAAADAWLSTLLDLSDSVSRQMRAGFGTVALAREMVLALDGHYHETQRCISARLGLPVSHPDVAEKTDALINRESLEDIKALTVRWNMLAEALPASMDTLRSACDGLLEAAVLTDAARIEAAATEFSNSAADASGILRSLYAMTSESKDASHAADGYLADEISSYATACTLAGEIGAFLHPKEGESEASRLARACLTANPAVLCVCLESVRAAVMDMDADTFEAFIAELRGLAGEMPSGLVYGGMPAENIPDMLINEYSTHAISSSASELPAEEEVLMTEDYEVVAERVMSVLGPVAELMGEDGPVLEDLVYDFCRTGAAGERTENIWTWHLGTLSEGRLYGMSACMDGLTDDAVKESMTGCSPDLIRKVTAAVELLRVRINSDIDSALDAFDESAHGGFVRNRIVLHDGHAALLDRFEGEDSAVLFSDSGVSGTFPLSGITPLVLDETVAVPSDIRDIPAAKRIYARLQVMEQEDAASLADTLLSLNEDGYGRQLLANFCARPSDGTFQEAMDEYLSFRAYADTKLFDAVCSDVFREMEEMEESGLKDSGFFLAELRQDYPDGITLYLSVPSDIKERAMSSPEGNVTVGTDEYTFRGTLGALDSSIAVESIHYIEVKVLPENYGLLVPYEPDFNGEFDSLESEDERQEAMFGEISFNRLQAFRFTYQAEVTVNADAIRDLDLTLDRTAFDRSQLIDAFLMVYDASGSVAAVDLFNEMAAKDSRVMTWMDDWEKLREMAGREDNPDRTKEALAVLRPLILREYQASVIRNAEQRMGKDSQHVAFIRKLIELYPEGVKLYHNTTDEAWESIWRDGYLKASENEDEGVYTVLGKPNPGRTGNRTNITVELPVELYDYDNIYPEIGTYYEVSAGADGTIPADGDERYENMWRWILENDAVEEMDAVYGGEYNIGGKDVRLLAPTLQAEAEDTVIEEEVSTETDDTPGYIREYRSFCEEFEGYINAGKAVPVDRYLASLDCWNEYRKVQPMLSTPMMTWPNSERFDREAFSRFFDASEQRMAALTESWLYDNDYIDDENRYTDVFRRAIEENDFEPVPRKLQAQEQKVMECLKLVYGMDIRFREAMEVKTADGSDVAARLESQPLTPELAMDAVSVLMANPVTLPDTAMTKDEWERLIRLPYGPDDPIFTFPFGTAEELDMHQAVMHPGMKLYDVAASLYRHPQLVITRENLQLSHDFNETLNDYFLLGAFRQDNETRLYCVSVEVDFDGGLGYFPDLEDKIPAFVRNLVSDDEHKCSIYYADRSILPLTRQPLHRSVEDIRADISAFHKDYEERIKRLIEKGADYHGYHVELVGWKPSFASNAESFDASLSNASLHLDGIDYIDDNTGYYRLSRLLHELAVAKGELPFGESVRPYDLFETALRIERGEENVWQDIDEIKTGSVLNTQEATAEAVAVEHYNAETGEWTKLPEYVRAMTIHDVNGATPLSVHGCWNILSASHAAGLTTYYVTLPEGIAPAFSQRDFSSLEDALSFVEETYPALREGSLTHYLETVPDETRMEDMAMLLSACDLPGQEGYTWREYADRMISEGHPIGHAGASRYAFHDVLTGEAYAVPRTVGQYAERMSPLSGADTAHALRERREIAASEMAVLVDTLDRYGLREQLCPRRSCAADLVETLRNAMGLPEGIAPGEGYTMGSIRALEDKIKELSPAEKTPGLDYLLRETQAEIERAHAIRLSLIFKKYPDFAVMTAGMLTESYRTARLELEEVLKTSSRLDISLAGEYHGIAHAERDAAGKWHLTGTEPALDGRELDTDSLISCVGKGLVEIRSVQDSRDLGVLSGYFAGLTGFMDTLCHFPERAAFQDSVEDGHEELERLLQEGCRDAQPWQEFLDRYCPSGEQRRKLRAFLDILDEPSAALAWVRTASHINVMLDFDFVSERIVRVLPEIRSVIDAHSAHAAEEQIPEVENPVTQENAVPSYRTVNSPEEFYAAVMKETERPEGSVVGYSETVREADESGKNRLVTGIFLRHEYVGVRRVEETYPSEGEITFHPAVSTYTGFDGHGFDSVGGKELDGNGEITLHTEDQLLRFWSDNSYDLRRRSAGAVCAAETILASEKLEDYIKRIADVTSHADDAVGWFCERKYGSSNIGKLFDRLVRLAEGSEKTDREQLETVLTRLRRLGADNMDVFYALTRFDSNKGNLPENVKTFIDVFLSKEYQQLCTLVRETGGERSLENGIREWVLPVPQGTAVRAIHCYDSKSRQGIVEMVPDSIRLVENGGLYISGHERDHTVHEYHANRVEENSMLGSLHEALASSLERAPQQEPERSRNDILAEGFRTAGEQSGWIINFNGDTKVPESGKPFDRLIAMLSQTQSAAVTDVAGTIADFSIAREGAIADRCRQLRDSLAPGRLVSAADLRDMADIIEFAVTRTPAYAKVPEEICPVLSGLVTAGFMAENGFPGYAPGITPEDWDNYRALLEESGGAWEEQFAAYYNEAFEAVIQLSTERMSLSGQFRLPESDIMAITYGGHHVENTWNIYYNKEGSKRLTDSVSAYMDSHSIAVSGADGYRTGMIAQCTFAGLPEASAATVTDIAAYAAGHPEPDTLADAIAAIIDAHAREEDNPLSPVCCSFIADRIKSAAREEYAGILIPFAFTKYSIKRVSKDIEDYLNRGPENDGPENGPDGNGPQGGNTPDGGNGNGDEIPQNLQEAITRQASLTGWDREATLGALSREDKERINAACRPFLERNADDFQKSCTGLADALYPLHLGMAAPLAVHDFAVSQWDRPAILHGDVASDISRWVAAMGNHPNESPDLMRMTYEALLGTEQLYGYITTGSDENRQALRDLHARAMACVCLRSRLLPSDREALCGILMGSEHYGEVCAAWRHPLSQVTPDEHIAIPCSVASAIYTGEGYLNGVTAQDSAVTASVRLRGGYLIEVPVSEVTVSDLLLREFLDRASVEQLRALAAPAVLDRALRQAVPGYVPVLPVLGVLGSVYNMKLTEAELAARPLAPGIRLEWDNERGMQEIPIQDVVEIKTEDEEEKNTGNSSPEPGEPSGIQDDSPAEQEAALEVPAEGRTVDNTRFRLSDFDMKEVFSKNLEAIRTAVSVNCRIEDGEKVTLTAQEAEALSSFLGYGPLKCMHYMDEPKEAWPKSLAHMYDAVQEFKAEIGQMRLPEGLSASQLLDSIRLSVNTAFYTENCCVDGIVGSIARILRENGCTVESTLDPSAGDGRFGQAMAAAFRSSRNTMIEFDHATALILRARSAGKANVIDAGFEEVRSRLGEYDVVGSNYPFDNSGVFDKEWSVSPDSTLAASCRTLHDYFALAGMDRTRPGGINYFITTRGFANSKANSIFREALCRQGRLIAAVRLPENLFSATSGTALGSDLFIFQKFGENTLHDSRIARLFASSGTDTVEDRSYKWNALFRDADPQYVLAMGEHSLRSNAFGEMEDSYTWLGSREDFRRELSDFIRTAMKNNFVAEDYGQAVKETHPKPSTQLSLFPSDFVIRESTAFNFNNCRLYGILSDVRDGSYHVMEGQLGRYEVTVSGEHMFVPQNSPNGADLLTAYVALRDTYKELEAYEGSLHSENTALRAELNRLYDAFRSQYGSLSDNAALIRSDAYGTDCLCLEYFEDGAYRKSDIFTRPISFTPVSLISTAEEAYMRSLDTYGYLNFPQMVSAYKGHDSSYYEEHPDEYRADGLMLFNELSEQGLACFDPSESIIYSFRHHGELDKDSLPAMHDVLFSGIVHSTRFLSGNVYDKYDRCEDAAREIQRLYADTVLSRVSSSSMDQLLTVRPRFVPFSDLRLNFGERWISTRYFSDYLSKVFEADIKVEYLPDVDDFVLSASNSTAVMRTAWSVKYGDNSTYDAMQLAHDALCDIHVPQLNKTVGYGNNRKTVPDSTARVEASMKIETLRQGFRDFLAHLPEGIKDNLASQYNRLFNCHVRPEYDGRYQTFQGMTLEKMPFDSLRDSQKNAIAMIKQNGGGLCAFCVGAGKTEVIICSAMEMRRLGLAQKPLIVCLKANIQQIANTFRTMYPHARILCPTEKEYSAKNRQAFFQKVKNNSWDAVIITNDQFSRIPQSPAIQREVIEKELAEIRASLEVVEKSWSFGSSTLNSRQKRSLNSKLKTAEAKLLALNERLAKNADDLLDFEQMGFDHILVDESHKFKNLAFSSRHTNVAGLGGQHQGQATQNMLYAIRTIQKRTGRDLGATFLTGTPITNSLTEMYAIFKYLRPKALERQGITCFDAWASVYTEKTSEFEFGVGGRLKEKERFRIYKSVPELCQFYSEITDFKDARDIGLERPEANIQSVVVPQSDGDRDFNDRLLRFIDTKDGRYIYRDELTDSEKKSYMLLATNASLQAALSLQLVVPDAMPDEQSKSEAVAANVARIYQQFNEHKGTQFIFCDRSTPQPGFNVYDEIKDLLITKHNIPKEEIAFIHSATEKTRGKMLDDFNEGRIRVLFGSTDKLGTGVNAQKHVVAIHHVDIPWKPSELEQRNGRGIRQGNETARLYNGNKVDIFIYGKEKSLDVYKYELLQQKQRPIDQINHGAAGARYFEDVELDEQKGMSYKELAANLSGNTLMVDKARLEKKLSDLEGKEKVFLDNISKMRQSLNLCRSSQDSIREKIGSIEKDRDMKVEPVVSLRREGQTVKYDLRDKEQAKLFIKAIQDFRGPSFPLGKVIGSFGAGGEFAIHVQTPTVIGQANQFSLQSRTGMSYNGMALPLAHERIVAFFPGILDRIPDILKKEQQALSMQQQREKSLKDAIAEPFPKSGELAALRVELSKLETEIASTYVAHLETVYDGENGKVEFGADQQGSLTSVRLTDERNGNTFELIELQRWLEAHTGDFRNVEPETWEELFRRGDCNLAAGVRLVLEPQECYIRRFRDKEATAKPVKDGEASAQEQDKAKTLSEEDRAKVEKARTCGELDVLLDLRNACRSDEAKGIIDGFLETLSRKGAGLEP